MIIALAGNPNCGKTTLFNLLTGGNQYVGNWSGVTVERKEGTIKGENEIKIIDFPGVYSLSPHSPEEIILRDYLQYEKPDVILNVIDATCLRRSLFLTLQLAELGIPIVVALNMYDEVIASKQKINVQELCKALKTKVVKISATKRAGINELINETKIAAKTNRERELFIDRNKQLNAVLDDICKNLSISISVSEKEWLSLKLLENDELIAKNIKLNKKEKEVIQSICEKNIELQSEISRYRYRLIEKISDKCVEKQKYKESVSDKADKVLTNSAYSLPILILIIASLYAITFYFGGIVSNGFEILLKTLNNMIKSGLTRLNANIIFISFISDGILSGIISVLLVLPQIIFLYFGLSLLEDCGYMSRVAFLADGIFSKIGLSGKAFISFILSTGCGVPAVMSTRTIENDRQRKLTVMLTTFIPCGAKIPIIALSATLLGGKWYIAPLSYLFCVFTVVLGALILNSIRYFKESKTMFIMELPTYRLPEIKSVLLRTAERVRSFAIRAGTVIALASAIVWFLASFNFRLEYLPINKIGESVLATIGKVLTPLLSPLGLGNNWQISVAFISGFIAKENVVATLGVLGTPSELFVNSASILSFLVFTLLSPPCVGAITAIKREVGFKWMIYTVSFMFITAYVSAYVVYQAVLLFLGKGNILSFAISLIITAIIIFLFYSADIGKKVLEINGAQSKCRKCGKACPNRYLCSRKNTFTN